jgi:general secretion pathway protein D
MPATGPRVLPRFRSGTNGMPAYPSYPGMSPMSPAPGSPVQPLYPAAGFPAAGVNVPSAPAEAAQPEETIPPGTIDFQGVDVQQVLEVYSKLVHRTLIRGNLPNASIVLKTETPLTRSEAIEALHAVLALNNISVIDVGEKFVKVVQSDQANAQGGTVDNSNGSTLPEMGSYVTHIVQLQWVKPSEMVPIIQPFARLQNSILPIDSNGILVLRDYAENVKRMLEMIARIDVSVPAEYISEVIPIKYALAGDIANALNSLGGGGGSSVSVGGSSGTTPINGVAGNRPSTGLSGYGGTGSQTGINTPGGASGSTQFGQRPQGTTTTPNGTPAAGTSFQQRLNAIINRASGTGGQQDQIQVFGQTKIIADSRANALLIFATRQDMAAIKKVISQLDVLLSQVLIEAVIIDYSLGPNTLNFGVSVAQNPQTYSPSIPVVGGGGFNNGPSFVNFLSGLTNGYTTGSNVVSDFASSLGSGFSYFGNIGPTWDVALQAAAADSHASIIQRPRIQTSQAKPAQFFVGETVPYVTSTYNYGGINGNQSSYSQLSVGVELDVTPFINPDGLVVMDVNQEIDDLDGTTQIEGVGAVPNTDKRTLNSEIAVKDRDTVMLGGFIKSNKSTSRSGVPVLMDIPIIGNLFTSRSDSKQREELIVLMRPTVLKTPDIAALQTIKEEQRLAGVSQAAAEDAGEQRKLIDAERKRELRQARATGHPDGFYAQPMPETNAPAPQPDAGTLNNDSSGAPAQPQSQNDAMPATAPAAPPTPVTPVQPKPLGKDDGFFYDSPPKQ